MIPLVKAFQVGDLVVHQLSDGLTNGQRQSWFTGFDPAIWAPVVGVPGLETEFVVNFGPFLITGDGHNTLVDSGLGHEMGAAMAVGGGELLQRLEEVGLTPPDIDHVVQTHLHSDHCGWLADLDGQVVFPRAEVFLNRNEFAYWTTALSHDDPMSPFVRSQLEPVQDAGLLRLFDGDHRVSDTLTCIFTPGHTPGHVSVHVSGGSDEVLLMGDVIHHPVHFEHNEWLPAIDQDPEESVRSRRRMCDLAIERGALVTAPHMPPLTLGRLIRGADGTSVEYIAVETPDGWSRSGSAPRDA